MLGNQERQEHSILVVVGRLDLGGTERHLSYILPKLHTAGYKICVFALSRGGHLETELEESGIEILGTNCKGPKIFKLIVASVALLKTLWKIRPSVIHFFLPEAYIIGGVASLFAPKARRVMSRRSLNNYQRKRLFSGAMEKILHKTQDVILANSQAIKKQLITEGAATAKLRLIYNGVPAILPEETAAEEFRDTCGISESTVLILMVANLIPYKGYHDILSALAMLRINQQTVPWHFLSVGRDAGIRAELENIAAGLKIQQHISWYGHMADIRPALAAADVAVLSSHEEGFSNFILEAMSASLPLVVTNVGGNAEAVLDNVSGYVVPARTPELLADKLSSLIEDRSRRKAFGAAGFERVNAKFSIQDCVARYLDVYDDLLVNK